MPDDLHQRYQAAHRAYQLHAGSCGAGCARDIPRCRDGKRLYELFARLQDAYLNRLRQSRKR
ncbi:hypothetical protein [Streptomyces sp. NPDC040750]|uniref:hypothetical protein n=1 Tax=Streptomyces sp. NPDC040750 TaxID=3154491 RepID=UPI0033F1FD4B